MGNKVVSRSITSTSTSSAQSSWVGLLASEFSRQGSAPGFRILQTLGTGQPNTRTKFIEPSSDYQAAPSDGWTLFTSPQFGPHVPTRTPRRQHRIPLQTLQCSSRDSSGIAPRKRHELGERDCTTGRVIERETQRGRDVYY